MKSHIAQDEAMIILCMSTLHDHLRSCTMKCTTRLYAMMLSHIVCLCMVSVRMESWRRFCSFSMKYPTKTYVLILSHNVLIDGICKEGKSKEARKLFYKMPNKNICLDVVTYILWMISIWKGNDRRSSKCFIR